jgi:type IV pilus assembly protein PilA
MMADRRAYRRTRDRNDRGFTLIEILIVIVVAGILMAMAAFSLLRARASANEASAIATLKSINSAQLAYNAACGRGYYAASLPILAMPPHEAASGGYIDAELGTAPVVDKSGYRVRVQIGDTGTEGVVDDCNGNATVTSYYATAVPVTQGNTGTRGFATSQVGTIWQSADGTAPPEPFGPPSQEAQ